MDVSVLVSAWVWIRLVPSDRRNGREEGHIECKGGSIGRRAGSHVERDPFGREEGRIGRAKRDPSGGGSVQSRHTKKKKEEEGSIRGGNGAEGRSKNNDSRFFVEKRKRNDKDRFGIRFGSRSRKETIIFDAHRI